jgi:hypothetical protein
MSDLIQRHLSMLRGASMDLAPNQVKKVEAATKLAVEHIICAVEALLVIMLFSGVGARFITNLVGFAYPAIQTIRTIEAKEVGTEWLTYWIVFATFNLLDPFVNTIIIYWVPFFYPLKASFLLWMMLPSTRGSLVVHRFLTPHFASIAATAPGWLGSSNALDTEMRKTASAAEDKKNKNSEDPKKK